jgi:hypothetical protein
MLTYAQYDYNGPIAWAVTSNASAGHVTSSCVTTGSWNEASTTDRVVVLRNTYPAGWITCWDVTSYPGDGWAVNNPTSVGMTGACAAANWPAGQTWVSATGVMWHSGHSVSGTTSKFVP